MKKLIVLLGVAGMAVAAWAADIPVIARQEFRNTGPTATYIAGTGTNSVLDVDVTGQIPFKLSEVTITLDGTASTNAVVSRVWQYQRRKVESQVTTNFFGTVQTNLVNVGYVNSAQTNIAYKADDTTPVKDVWFMQGDLMVIDTKVTNCIVRITGSF